MILDISFLLDLKDGEQGAFEKATELYDSGVVQRVAMPSVWELHRRYEADAPRLDLGEEADNR